MSFIKSSDEAGEALHSLAEQLSKLEGQLESEPAQTRAKLLALLVKAQDEHDPYSESYALCLLGGCAFFQGKYSETLRLCGQALALSRAGKFQTLESRCLNALGLASMRMNTPDEALNHYLGSLRLSIKLGDEPGRSRVLANMGTSYIILEEYEKALELYRESLQVAQGCNQLAYAADAVAGMINALRGLRRYGEGLSMLPQVLDWCAGSPFPRVECNVRLNEAAMLLATGQPQQGLKAVVQGMAVAHCIGDHESKTELSRLAGELYTALGDYPAAYLELQGSLREAKALGNVPLERDVHASLSRFFEYTGKHEQALEHVRKQQALEQILRTNETERRMQALDGQVRFEVLRREAETERQRNIELAATNSVLQQTQIELTHRATHDNLTGMINRTQFWTRAQRVVEGLAPGDHTALIFADIDGLKAINERFGHAAGDFLMMELAQRMRQSVRSGDLVGRVSGDEFMILLTHLASPDDVDLVANKLLNVLRQPVVYENKIINPTLSLGSVVAPQDGTTMQTLHKHADLAMYQAKSQGGNRVVRFEVHMSVQEQERRSLEQDLRSAISTGQLRLHYQGLFRLPKQELMGFEALVRWQHPERGLIPPNKFIPLAEESRLILELGNWVLQEACRQAREWQLPERGLSVSVNVSALQFEQPDFVQVVEQALRLYHLPGCALILELTETMVYRDFAQTKISVRALQALGVKVALDDFGTGYSSLSMLKQLPFQHLKVDRSFLQDLNIENEQFKVARRFMEIIVNLAQSLNMRVIAEGVETLMQYELLCELGCDKAQGFYMARPVPAEEARLMLPQLLQALPPLP